MQSCRLYRAESEKRNQKKWHGHLTVQKWQKRKEKKKDLPSRYISEPSWMPLLDILYSPLMIRSEQHWICVLPNSCYM